MFSKNSPRALQLRAALFCVIGCTALVFNLANVSAQKTRFTTVKQNFGNGPILTATLTDAFPDPNGDGRAAFGAEVTYTAKIANSGDVNAANVVFTNPIDANSTIVADSVQVQPDLNPYAVSCTFSTGNGGNGNCSWGSGPYGVTDANLDTIIGGQFNNLNVVPSNISYDAGTGIFQFDAAVQNLISNALGTLDGTTADASGIRLFLQNSRIISGSGSVSVANADGTGTFTSPNQPYFQYSQILQKDEFTLAKTVQLNIDDTVNTFTVEFLVSTKAQVKVVINEVLANPGGTISDANGEWFELYNAGWLPVNLKNFKINDFANANANGCTTFPCERPSHVIASDLIIQPGSYTVFGNTTNTTNNGGVPVDYAYGAALALANSQDGVRVQTPDASDALTLDQTIYRSAAVSAQNGISRELLNSALDNVNMDASNWGDALVTAVYGPGGRGTPKDQNSTFTPFAETFADKSSTAKSSAGEASAVKNLVPVVNNAGETVSANLGTITPGGFATVTYRVTVADPMPAGVTQLSNQGSVSSTNFGDIVTNDPATPAANDATITPVGTLAPTAALVSISGRVSDGSGRAVSGAQVGLVDSNGTTRTSRTNSFGYYRFADLAAGSTVTISVKHKLYVFEPQVIPVSDNITDLNFTAQNIF